MTASPTDRRQFLKATGRSFEGSVVRYQLRGEKAPCNIVVVPPGDAEAFRYWLLDQDRAEGFLTNEHHYGIEALPYVEGGGSSTEEDDSRSGSENRDVVSSSTLS